MNMRSNQLFVSLYERKQGIKRFLSQVWWHTPVFPTLRRLRQKDLKFKASIGHTENSRPAWAT
jgi:hypothetical protein